jgi:DNA-binding LacI/PurR family transcriptional regulator
MSGKQQATAPKLGRPDERRREIAAELKAKIVSGAWAPGAKIPTRRDLCDQFDASPITIQHILRDLEKDGFIRSEGRNGTFLNADAPHLADVALVLSTTETHNRLWLAISKEASAPRSDGLRISIRKNIDGHLENQDYKKLLQDVLKRRLMGLFFTSSPFQVDETPIVIEPGIPRVSIMSSDKYPGFSRIDFAPMHAKALGFLKARGRSRIAVLGHPEIHLCGWEEAISNAGLKTHSYWIQGMDLNNSFPARRLAQLLVNPNQTERPDALVITDDNLVENATRGLYDSGVRIPEDLEIVAHCNFPWPPPCAVPVTRLGYDAKEILESAMQLLRELKAGAPPRCVYVKALFERELTK